MGRGLRPAMTWRVVADPRAARAGWEAAGRRLLEDATGQVEARISWPGGRRDGRLLWHARSGVWSHCDDDPDQGRLYLWYGLGQPVTGRTHVAACETNVPKQGADRRVQGLLAQDDEGRLHVLHQGRFGGGPVRVTPEEFLSRWDAHQTVGWPGRGGTSTVAHVACLEDDDFVGRVARFARAVDALKREKRGRAS